MDVFPKQILAICELEIRRGADKDILVAKFKTGNVKLQIFAVERLNKENINAIINQYRALPKPSIITVPHINSELAKRLQASKVQFLDSSGNIFLENSLGYVFIVGEKKMRSKIALSSPFSVAGIKLIFALLSDPGLEDGSYRTLARAANVSLGSIETLIRGLKHHDFIVEVKNNKRRLKNKKELLNRWCIAFSERLESKLILSRLSCDNKQWWKEVELDPKTALWGGEVAAAKLTKYLKPGTVSIYAENTLPALQAKYGLRKNDHGEVIIYKRFWNFLSEPDRSLAPALLIYAELMNSGESRSVETARIIYEKYLSKVIE